MQHLHVHSFEEIASGLIVTFYTIETKDIVVFEANIYMYDF